MNRDKEFEDILEECLERMLTHGDSFEQCLKLHPEYAERLEPLLKTAASVNRAVNVKPSAEFKTRAAYQMSVAMGDRTPSKYYRHWWQWHPRWALAIGVAITVLVLGTGTVFAANVSMPGSPLYPVKLTTENVRLKLAGSEIQKATLYAEFAEKRITEMTSLVEMGQTQQVPVVARRFDDIVTGISNLSLADETDTRMLAAQAPEMAPTEFATAPPITIPTPAKGIEPTGSADTASTNDQKNLSDKDNLKRELIQQSVDFPEKLRRLLDSQNTTEEDKIAIRQAISIAETSYRQALEQLGR